MSALMRAAALRCEHREDVPCLDETAPRLTWALESAGRDKRQTSYRILVAESAEDLAAEHGSLWDSGRVRSGASVDIVYAGRPLPAATECLWAVQVWDEAGQPGPWSDPASFRIGLAEWRADWIFRDHADDPVMAVPGEDPETEADRQLVLANPSPHLRRRFHLEGSVRHAMLYATARGVVELQINGVRVGDSVLAPGWTDYRRRIEYAAYDVTDLLGQGENVLAAILGDGWYAGFVGFDARRAGAHYGDRPELLCELHIEHDGGEVEVVASDAEWRGSVGPIRYSDLLHGEYYDARRELKGWSEPGYEDDSWLPVETRARDDVLLVAERGQPIRVTEELRPVSVAEPHPGIHVFDLGQNLVGWVRLVVRGERGTTVRLRFAEMLNPDGSLYLDNLRGARPVETYILRGDGDEVYEPRFTFHGFRYVEVTGLPDRPTLDTITGRVAHSDTPWTGRFECSDEMVNQLWRNITWGQRGNFISVPTDCPQRDERLGWLADAQVFLPTAALNMDVAAFMTKWGDDVLDAQSPGGAYPDVAPRLVLERDGAPGWADGGIIVPWTMYRRYGDVRMLERHWDAMERYMAYLVLQNPDLLWTNRRNYDFGDWLSVGAETPHEVLATAYFAYDATLMACIADVLGKPDSAVHYQRLRAGIVAAFNRAYVDDDARIEGDTQTVYVLALHMDLLPQEQRARAAERLVEDIERHDWHLTTGFLGVGLLCPVLSEAGYSDVAHRLLLTDSFPSWGYSIRHGATTIWERWDGWTEERGFQTPMMNSFNHYSLGSVGQWLYENVAGIRCDRERPGYAHVVIAPEPGELEHASATYRSVRGPISSSWRQTETAFDLDVDIPANVSATIVFPCGGGGRLIEGDTEASEAIGVRSAVRDDRGWTVELGSGRYAFSLPLQQPAAAWVS